MVNQLVDRFEMRAILEKRTTGAVLLTGWVSEHQCKTCLTLGGFFIHIALTGEVYPCHYSIAAKRISSFNPAVKMKRSKVECYRTELTDTHV